MTVQLMPTLDCPSEVAFDPHPGGPTDAPPRDWLRTRFVLPPEREASEPPEARGLARDEVRLLVSHRDAGRTSDAQFRDLPCYLESGDLLVINTSRTMNAAVPVTDSRGRHYELRLSTHLPGGLWSVELRRPAQRGTDPYYDAPAGMQLQLPAGATALLHAPYDEGRQTRKRLWLASLHLPLPAADYLSRYGFPIRYAYVKDRWPNEYYQTVFATEVGSAEMPSAGRPFSPDLITRLVANGIQIAPLLLHTGVATLDEDERPYQEYYRVPATTAHLVNATRGRGKRVVAVGTTVVRALETVTAEDGTTYPGEGWTGLVIIPGYWLRAASALLTGFHEPRSTHLHMLEAFAGEERISRAYSRALREGYLWHEFGDMHLFL